MNERRRYPRVQVSCAVLYSTVARPGAMLGSTLDLGMGGARIETSHGISEGDDVEISIPLPGQVIRLKGSVVQVSQPEDKKDAEARIRFAEVPKEDRLYLEEYLSFLMGRQKESREPQPATLSETLHNQEKEKRRLAQELLDKVGDPLAAIRLQLQRRLEHPAKGPLPPGTSLQEVISGMQRIIQEVRQISADLYPLVLEHLGILTTIRWFCSEFKAGYPAIRLEEETAIKETEIPEPLKIVIFRIVKEALERIGKHCDADLVRLSLKKTGDVIQLSMSDNGKGSDLREAEGIKRRVEASGGTFSLDTTVGTVIEATWVKR